MTDIVDRLRAEGKDALAKHASLGMYGLCSDAADEIERLRSSLADAFSAYFQTNDGTKAAPTEVFASETDWPILSRAVDEMNRRNAEFNAAQAVGRAVCEQAQAEIAKTEGDPSLTQVLSLAQSIQAGMSKQGFTSGPWFVGEYEEHGGYDCMTGAVTVGPVVLDGHTYGQGRCTEISDASKARMMADARLISAAPDLLEALERLMDSRIDESVAVEQARAAIAKAKGGEA